MDEYALGFGGSDGHSSWDGEEDSGGGGFNDLICLTHLVYIISYPLGFVISFCIEYISL